MWCITIEILLQGNGMKITTSAVFKSSLLLWFAVSISNTCVRGRQFVTFTCLWLSGIRGPIGKWGSEFNAWFGGIRPVIAANRQLELIGSCKLSHSGRSHTWPNFGFSFFFHIRQIPTPAGLKHFYIQTVPVAKRQWSSVQTMPKTSCTSSHASCFPSVSLGPCRRLVPTSHSLVTNRVCSGNIFLSSISQRNG